MRRTLLLLAASLCLVPSLRAQAKPNPQLVTWYGLGGIPLPVSPDWKLDNIVVYDKGERPAASFHNDKTSVMVSFLLFNGYPDTPTAQGCRNDAIHPIVKNEGKAISKLELGDLEGGRLATASYRTAMGGAAYNQARFVFAGNARVCAEVHVSTSIHGPDEDARLQAALDLFHPALDYAPTAMDRFLMGNLLYEKDPMQAAPYYKEAIDAMPPDDATLLTPRRVATDNLVMALGMSGDLKGSRAVAQRAIATDPDYPLNYYNLACADAEDGNAAAARTHLEQAWARRANMIPGEHFPNPAADDSLQKLKGDKAFWSYVQSLSSGPSQ